MRARFYVPCDESRAEGSAVFASRGDYWTRRRVVYKLIASWQLNPGTYGRVGDTDSLKLTVIYRTEMSL